MDINYELYKVFYYVASSLSFSDASKKLFISQSAFSHALNRLREELNDPLFVRTNQGMEATPRTCALTP